MRVDKYMENEGRKNIKINIDNSVENNISNNIKTSDEHNIINDIKSGSKNNDKSDVRNNDEMKSKIKNRAGQIEQMISRYLPAEEGRQKIIVQAMKYSFLSGGKRLRPMLMYETYRMFGGNGTVIEPFMAAIEMIHTYSLIHDDLPAMDNDEYRRGRKTTHVVYGEAMGILAGDALLNYAFETAAGAFALGQDPVRIAHALQILAKKAGIYGMIGGQVVDVLNEAQCAAGKTYEKECNDEKECSDEKEYDALERKEIQHTADAELLDFIYRLKTGALIEASMMIGAVLAGADQQEVTVLEQIAGEVGLAFQIQDDILDVTSTLEELGKPIGSDEKNQKVTYVSLYGLETAKMQVEKLTEQAVGKIESLQVKNEFLNELLLYLVQRRS